MALLWSAQPGLRHNIAASRTALNNSAVDILSTLCGTAGPPNNVYGWGRVDVRAAVGLVMTGGVSRKTHGAAGTFDVPLPLSGAPGVECRSSSGNHTFVFSFINNVVSGNASVTTGIGTVLGSPTFSGNTMTVNLTGVTDVQKITVTLTGVTDTTAQVLPDTPVSVNMLIGDTNANKSVNAGDLAQTKAQSGVVVTGANFRTDINANGSVNAGDTAIVKANAGHTLP
jgi:hypothetical protein